MLVVQAFITTRFLNVMEMMPGGQVLLILLGHKGEESALNIERVILQF